MEIDLETLQKVFDGASAKSNHDLLKGHDLTVFLHTYEDHMDIDVFSHDTLETVVTIRVPAKVRTTLTF